jgi:hypothetical protein
MAFRIVLSHHASAPFLPGDLVCGVVKLVATSEGWSESVSISYTGRTVVSLTQNAGEMVISPATYGSCGYLFRQNLILQKENHLHEKETYAWPFAFHIPHHASFACTNECSFTDSDGLFECEPLGEVLAMLNPFRFRRASGTQADSAAPSNTFCRLD